MKQLIEALKSARKLEWCILAAVLGILLALGMGSGLGDGGASTEERRMERVLSNIEGAGRVTVMLSGDEEAGYTGAVVASPGAGDIAVALQLQRAVQALTELELEEIEIVKSGR